ncbi:MAG: hypothetical protein PPP58_12565 [Natronomonas sp.]
MRYERGQFVLVAAAVVAVALAAILLAYLQLAAHPDLTGSSGPETPTGDETLAVLDRATHEAVLETAGDHEWDERTDRAVALRDELTDPIESLETARIDEGVVRTIGYNTTAAAAWNRLPENCPRGNDRRFGGCTAIGGIVLQERAGEAVALAVAFDVRIVGPDGYGTLTVIVTLG